MEFKDIEKADKKTAEEGQEKTVEDSTEESTEDSLKKSSKEIIENLNIKGESPKNDWIPDKYYGYNYSPPKNDKTPEFNYKTKAPSCPFSGTGMPVIFLVLPLYHQIVLTFFQRNPDVGGIHHSQGVRQKAEASFHHRNRLWHDAGRSR